MRELILAILALPVLYAALVILLSLPEIIR